MIAAVHFDDAAESKIGHEYRSAASLTDGATRSGERSLLYYDIDSSRRIFDEKSTSQYRSLNEVSQ